jgi:uncharacterized heparinase superfamily protein
MTAPDTCRFLNVEGALGETGWDHEAADKLWRYNLHYFDDLNSESARARQGWHRDLIARWVADNPPGQGTGWEPYPVSLRIVNWVKWLLAGNEPVSGMIDSLAIQARWLAGSIEWHLLGNHLFANAKALVFAGRFFAGGEADRWSAAGWRIIADELDEQFLPDGGHFELSPMYHALALEDLLDLANLTRLYGVVSDGAAEIEALVPRAGRWLEAMLHPDGDIAFFNDAAFGIAPTPRELRGYAGRLGLAWPADSTPITWLRDSGYARLEAGDALLLADVARIGPDYLPGHAHADTLSFEFSLGDQRVIVNSGTGEYGSGPERLRQRGTAAHNCVIVDGRDSSDVWSGFRVGRRARPSKVSVGQAGNALVAQAAHDGYRFLPGKPMVARAWTLLPNRLVIDDRVTGGDHRAESRLHFHPAAEPRADGTVALPWRTMRWRSEGGPPRIAPSTWHPEFGLARPSHCLVVPLAKGAARLELEWD